jgi:hypothetical protein
MNPGPEGGGTGALDGWGWDTRMLGEVPNAAEGVPECCTNLLKSVGFGWPRQPGEVPYAIALLR